MLHKARVASATLLCFTEIVSETSKKIFNQRGPLEIIKQPDAL